MPFPPKEFQYFAAQSGILYQTHATGTLHIPSLVAGRSAHWLSRALPKKAKNKSLILADWSAIGWSYEKIELVQAALRRLMTPGENGTDEPFDLYLWQSGIITPLTKATLPCLREYYVRKAMMPDTPEKIEHAAYAQHGLIHDGIHLLDYYWINQLLAEPGDYLLKPDELSIHDFSSIPNRKRAEIVAFLRRSKPALRHIIFDEFSKEATSAWAYLKSQFPPAIMAVENCLYLKLDPHEMEALQDDRGITLSDVSLTIYHLLTCKSIDVSESDIEIWYLELLLFKMLNLERLNLSRCKNLSGLLTLEEGILPQLKEINLTGCNIEVESLEALCNAAPNLKILHLTACKTLSTKFLLAANSLKHLEEIHLDSSNITAENLQILCMAAPGLRILHLSHWNSNSETLMIPAGCLPDLERMRLAMSSINEESLQALLLAAPRLKKLDLFECKHLPGAIAPKMKALEEVVLYYCNITAENLQTLLLNSPDLRKLDLGFCQNLMGTLKLEPGSLGNLMALDLRCSQITVDNVQVLLAAASNLKTLALGRANISGIIFSINRHLESLDLRGSNITHTQLQTLLASVPYLKSLDLSDCTNLTETMKLGADSLRHLESIRVIDGSITIENLYVLFSAAPNLTTLELYGFKLLFDAAIFDFKKLEHLSLGRNSITSTSLQAILVAAPNLKSMHLFGCKHLKVPFNVTPGSLKHLKSINIGGSAIDVAILKTLLLAAPDLYHLELSQSSTSMDTMTLDEVILKNLEKMNLSGSLFSVANLQALLFAAPHLVTLYLPGIDGSWDTLSLRPGHFKDLKTMYTKGSCITIERLNMLLKSAPAMDDLQCNDDRSFDDGDDVLVEAVHSITIHAAEPVIPKHNLTEFKDYRPRCSDDDDFVDHGMNTTKSVAMIREKLLQYISLTQQHLDHIPIIHSGLCNALSHYFIAQASVWDDFLRLALGWNGKLEALTTELRAHFNGLHLAITQYQAGNSRVYPNYLGDNLAVFFDACSRPCILNNPWHAIAVLPPPAESDEWTVYDNNFDDGPRKVKKIKLIETIRTILGSCILVESSETIPVHKIDNHKQFIQEGGLLALVRCSNVDVIVEELKSKPPLTRENLDGLLLRTTAGVPAWVQCIRNVKIIPLINILLKQFIRENPSNYAKQLQTSLAEMPLEERQGLITQVTEVAFPDLGAQLTNIIRSAPKTREYERALRTWNKSTFLTNTVDTYCQQCFSTALVKKRLIECTSTNDVAALRFALQAYCRATSRPVFYVHSPDDLICSAPHVYQIDDNKGELRRVGGPLYDFLHAPRAAGDPAPVIVVNYERFADDDIVRFNGLLDEKRKVDGLDLPDDVTVIGLLNIKKPGCYQGADFYSRFNVTEKCCINSLQLQSAIPALPISISATAASDYVINLFCDQDWKERLLGHWVLDKSSLIYQEGELQKAIAAGAKMIEIQNGLWENKDFLRFWQEAAATGFIEHNGRRIKLPTLIRRETNEYDWDSLKLSMLHEERLSAIPHVVLNPTTLPRFFSRYEVTVDHQLAQLDGYIRASAEGSVLPVYLTRTISNDEWAMVLTACKAHGIKFAVYCAPNVKLPTALQPALATSEAAIPPWDKTTLSLTQVIQSTDVDTTVAMLIAGASDWLVVDVSECKGSDLLEKITGGLHQESLRFHFSKTECDVFRALKEGKRVILKGEFSVELADELAALLLERHGAGTTGTLVLISDDTEVLRYASPHKHDVGTEEKLAQLRHLPSEIVATLTPHMADPLCQLQSRCNFLGLHPGESSDNAWAGMHRLPDGITRLEEFNASSSRVETEEFTATRKAMINRVLDEQPYVFISGLSGVGKSTFVTRELCQDEDTLYQGEASIYRWATAEVTIDATADGKKRRKLLLLDEATLSTGKWSAFEGLFATPPGILIDGVYYKLTSEHKVIFAGNPVSYGDERSLAPFFERHGNAVVFKTMPTAVIYEKILKPVLVGTTLADKAEDISKHVLDVYRFLCERSKTDIIISPRELQMMVLMVVSYCDQHSCSSDVENVTVHFAYEVAKHLVPDEHRAAFNSRFQPKAPLLQPAVKDKSTSDFFVTASRLPVRQFVDALLALHELRHSSAINDSIRYGGLGGIILEGEPGCGKSEMVLSMLVAKGYREMHDIYMPATTDAIFYRMPVSLSLDKKIQLLIKAFNEGAIVIIDEINSAPMMESLLNELLMGLHEGKPPVRPGFMIIGTQNPASMAGRRAPSTALARRLTTIELPPYNIEEMQGILCTLGLSDITAKELAEAYQHQVDFAKQKQFTPAPIFRDLLKLAKEVKRGQSLLVAESVVTAAIVPIIVSTKKEKTRSSIKELMTKYFAANGVFPGYLVEHASRYWLRESFGQFAALMFSCVGFQSEHAQRTEYIAQLQITATDYLSDPLANYGELRKLTRDGRRKFSEQIMEGPAYRRSFHAKLSGFQRELDEFLRESSSNETTPCLVCRLAL